MDVKIERGVEWRDDLRNVAPDLWPELIAEYRFFCQRALPTDCRSLLRMVDEAAHVEWAGYHDRESYLREGLGLDPRAVGWALDGLSIAGVEAPLPFKEAQQLGKHGGARSIRDETKQPYDVSLKDTKAEYGNSTAYREAKGKRDGLNQPAPYYREKPLTTLRRAWKRASPEDRATFLAEIAK